jgi:hypothetical protein
MPLTDDYLEKLKKRSSESHVYRSYQLAGLEIAELLGDERHKALYIKLAKQGSAAELMALAKQISKKKEVRNKGAYFMKIIQTEKQKGK